MTKRRHGKHGPPPKTTLPPLPSLQLPLPELAGDQPAAKPPRRAARVIPKPKDDKLTGVLWATPKRPERKPKP